MTEAEVRMVFITAPNGESARLLGETLVRERLAACANLVPGVTSFFRWDGAVLEESEVLLLVKTTSVRLPELFRRAKELHPYDLPELIAVTVDEGSAEYLSWVVHESAEEGG